MKYKSVTWSFVTMMVGCAALLCAPSANADQLLVTGANRDGNLVYDLGITPSSTTPSTPVIASSATLINSTADAATHGGFDALVWVPNSICKSLDLIVADASKGQILRYAGASTVSGCYDPVNGTPGVSPTAQTLFTWSKSVPGPAQPNGVSVDASGNVFVVSSSGGWDPDPSVWVLPFNGSKNQYCSGAAGVYCAPVLIDARFCGKPTLFLAETLVASTAAVTSNKTVLWNAGDLLVLVGDSFDARLMAYPHAKLYNSNGTLNLHALPLSAPPSTPIPLAKFLGELAAPFGMDLCPGNSALCPNASVLFTTIDGRILSFDTVQDKFVTDIADRRGAGLQKIKVGSYANVPYAFVTQLEVNNTGQILAFGPPPHSGPANNTPLATVSKIAVSNTSTTPVRNPMGLAVISAGSTSLPSAAHGSTPCAPPNAPCVVAPLGPELVSTISAYPGDNLSGTVVEQNCVVQTDPRVMGSGASWTCNGNALPIGAGTSICPSFPSAVIPGSVCGHSGPTGSGFVVIQGTATGIDPNLNNSFITTAGNIDAVLPGATNLECSSFVLHQIPGQIPLMAWGTRSDLTTVEGVIPEDSQFGSPLGGAPGYLTELTAGCDTSTTGSRELSIFAIGLGLSYTDQAEIYTLQNQKYEALESTVSTAAITNTPPSYVQSTLTADITTAENYVTASQGTYPGTTFTNNINCALNEIAATDGFLRANLPALSSNLVTVAPGGGNENPAGDIDGRLANWYTVLNTMLAGNAPYASWPLPPSSVPGCITSTQPQITSFTAPVLADNDNVIANWTSVNTTSCTLTSLYAFNFDDTGYNFDSASGLPIGGPGYGGYDIYYIIPESEGEQMSTPQFATPGWGSDTYTLTCYGAAGTTPATASLLNTSGFTGTTTLAIQNFTIDPAGYLGWTTTNSTEATTCTITDEFGGPPYNQPPFGPLPANQVTPEQSETGPYEQFPYWYDTAFCPADESTAQSTDTVTLTCSDQTTGTAFSQLTINNPYPPPTGCGF